MPRFAARADRNQAEIVEAARKWGGDVVHIHMVGRGCPDILVVYRGVWLPVEIKAPGGRLTTAEREWRERYGRHGPTPVWWTVDDVKEEFDRIDGRDCTDQPRRTAGPGGAEPGDRAGGASGA